MSQIMPDKVVDLSDGTAASPSEAEFLVRWAAVLRRGSGFWTVREPLPRCYQTLELVRYALRRYDIGCVSSAAR